MYVDDLRTLSFLQINEKWQAYQDNTLANTLINWGMLGSRTFMTKIGLKNHISVGDTGSSRWRDNDAADSMVRT